MASVVARHGRCECCNSRVSGQRNRKAVAGASDECQLASALKETVSFGEKNTPAKELFFKSLAAGGKQPSPEPVNETKSGSERNGKEKITVEQPAAAMSSVEQTPEQLKMSVKKKLEQRFDGVGKASVKPEGKTHVIEMDEELYESVVSLIDHTCEKGIDCSAFYTRCRYKGEAATIYFKKFLVKTFGRYGVRLFWGSWFGYNNFLCRLTEEQAEILRGEEGVKDVKILNKTGGHWW